MGWEMTFCPCLWLWCTFKAAQEVCFSWTCIVADAIVLWTLWQSSYQALGSTAGLAAGADVNKVTGAQPCPALLCRMAGGCCGLNLTELVWQAEGLLPCEQCCLWLQRNPEGESLNKWAQRGSTVCPGHTAHKFGGRKPVFFISSFFFLGVLYFYCHSLNFTCLWGTEYRISFFQVIEYRISYI